MNMLGANPSSTAAPSNELPGKVNYVPGTGPEARLTNIPTYGKVRYDAVYPGIDLVYYDNQGHLEYDFVVGPGADPKVIELAFDGARAIDIDDDGALVLHTGRGDPTSRRLSCTRSATMRRERIAGHWVRTGAGVGVRVGPYDRERPLVIDPLLTYSSYLGGSGDDWGMDIALDTAGNTYVAGGTTSPNFPGATPRATTSDAAFVTKLNAAGQLLYSTYLLETDERGATGIAVDPMGNAYVTGRTSHWRATASNDVFVAKLDAFGRVLRPSGYFVTFGGNLIDWGNRIAVDDAGNAYVAGVTEGGTFPTTPGAFRRVPAGRKGCLRHQVECRRHEIHLLDAARRRRRRLGQRHRARHAGQRLHHGQHRVDQLPGHRRCLPAHAPRLQYGRVRDCARRPRSSRR